jgi:ubiquinone biosynthesis protein
MLRLIAIGFAVFGVLVHATRARFSRSARSSLPRHFRATLERLGPPFVKLGQALSLRKDLLPDDVVAALQGLQDDVAGFPSGEARREIEHELSGSVEQVFSEFDDKPLAAASIAQVHRARLHDGREVIVDPAAGDRGQVDRDMRLLVVVLRVAGMILPALKRYGAVSLVREIWTRLRAETDFRQRRRACAGSSRIP